MFDIIRLKKLTIRFNQFVKNILFFAKKYSLLQKYLVFIFRNNPAKIKQNYWFCAILVRRDNFLIMCFIIYFKILTI